MRKTIAVFLVFSLLCLSGSLYAEKKGAEIVIHRMDGQQVKGELIAVKKSSLLLMERESRSDMSVRIGDIKKATIVKKSKILEGAGVGALTGGGIASLLTLGATNLAKTAMGSIDSEGSTVLKYSLVGAGIGLAIGSLSGIIQGKDETIQIEGKSEAEIKKTLEDLRKKARVPDFQ